MSCGPNCAIPTECRCDGEQLTYRIPARGVATRRSEAGSEAADSGAPTVSLTVNRTAEWERYFRSHDALVHDFLLAQGLFGENEDAILVTPGEGAACWVLALTLKSEDAHTWIGNVVHRKRPAEIDVGYAVSGIDEAERSLRLDHLFAQATSFLPTFALSGISSRQRTLVVKLDPAELWFARFPINLFCRFQRAGFGRYRDVEWIVTARTFCDNARIRQAMRRELLDPGAVIAQSVVVINTYDQDGQAEDYKHGTRLAQSVLACLEEVQLGHVSLRLRWRCNPSAEELAALLNDAQTTYFFADFEARAGQWELGHDSASAGEPAYFHPTAHLKSLSHLRLMRVFHCNSVFDPAAAGVATREPGDEKSIAGALLALGAQRVEGGFTEESYFDFLSTLFHTFASGQLGFILRFACLDRGEDFDALLRQINEFLARHGWPPIGAHQP